MQIEAALTAELATLATSARTAREAATHADSRPENKYDTRGLEASYLAGAQAARVATLSSQLQVLKSLDVKPLPPNSGVAATALVELAHGDQTSVYFVLAVGAGQRLTLGEACVQVVTPQSMLGRALLGRRAGDTVTVEMPQGPRDYEILSVR